MDGLQWEVPLVASFVAAAFDVGARRIPNLLTGPVFLLGLVQGFAAAGWGGVLDGLLGSLILGIPYVLLFAFAGGGAGDAKLMAAIGAWLGTRSGIPALLCVALAGMVLGLGFALWKGRFRRTLANLFRMVQSLLLWVFGKFRLTDARMLLPGEAEFVKMPYGIAIFVGLCAATGGAWIWGW